MDNICRSVGSLLLAMAPILQGGLVSVKLVSALEQQSDVIVVGSLTGVHSLGNNNLQCEITVTRILKSSFGPRSVINAHAIVSASRISIGVPPAGGPTSIWFLKQNGADSMLLIPAQDGDVDLQHMALFAQTAPPGGSYEYASSDGALDRIAKELGAFAENAPRLYMESEDSIAQSLQGVNTPVVINMLKRFANSPSRGLRALGLASLIQRGDSTSLLQFEADLKGPFADPVFQRSSGMLNIQAAIELMYRSNDVAGIQTLGRLATSPLTMQRLAKASLYALRAIHNIQTLPYLAQLLDSPDPHTSYDALFGMAAFANGFPISQAGNPIEHMTPNSNAPFASKDSLSNLPGFDTFIKDQPRFIGYWKQWWTKNQVAAVAP